MSTIGDQIRGLRRLHKVTQEDLASQIGISHTALNKIENGHIKNPKYVTIERICNTLGYDLAIIFRLEL